MKTLYDTETQTFLPAYPRADDEPVVGLDPRFEVYEIFELPAPDVGENQYLSPTETADHTAKTLTRGWQVMERPTMPIIVPFRALAFALLKAGLYEQAKAAACATPAGEIWWSTAQSTAVQRDHPFVAAIGAALGQTPEQIDALFAKASTIQA